jgi:hypothetical protein
MDEETKQWLDRLFGISARVELLGNVVLGVFCGKGVKAGAGRSEPRPAEAVSVE